MRFARASIVCLAMTRTGEVSSRGGRGELGARFTGRVLAVDVVRDERGQRRVVLSNESINKTLVRLANVLDTAVEHGLLASNPA